MKQNNGISKTNTYNCRLYNIIYYIVQNNHCENVKGNCTQELFHKYVEYDHPGEHSPE